MNFTKMPDESEDDFIYRVCSCKDEIGGWVKTADILNAVLHRTYDESTYRRRYNRMCCSPASMYVSSPICADDEDAVSRQRTMADKLEINRFLRQHSRFELFYEKIRDVIKPLDPPEIECIAPAEHDKDYVLTIADIHYGSAFESENNTYGKEIAADRMSKLLGYMVEYVHTNHITHVNVVGLGDDVQGILRMSDLQLNDGNVVDSIVGIARIWAAFLNQLSRCVNIDFYAVSSSNHSQTRPLGSQASALAGEDVEHIICAYISDVLVANDRVNVHYDVHKDYISFTILDMNMIAMHGHQFKSIENAVRDISQLHQKFYDYLFVGHLHSSCEMTVGERGCHNVEVLQSPSIIGSCPYADKIMKGSKAAAKLYKFDRQYGHVESKTFILN